MSAAHNRCALHNEPKCGLCNTLAMPVGAPRRTRRIGEHETHELAETLPMMTEAELAGLVDDVKTNGLRRPITLYDGKILDGRNRYLACLAAGVEPRFREHPEADVDDLIRYVVSENLSRRDLTPDARALAAQRLIRHAKRWNKDQLRLAHIDEDLIERVEEDAEPEVQRAVEAGEIALETAAAIATLEPEQQRDALQEATKPKPAPKQEARLVTVAFGYSAIEAAAAQSGYYVLAASKHAEVRAFAELVRRAFPTVKR